VANKKLLLMIALAFFMSLFIYNYALGLEKEIINDIVLNTSNPPSVSSLESNRYTKQEDDYGIVVNEYVTKNGYQLLGSNQNSDLEFYFRSSDLSFIVEDLRSGYLWGSTFNPMYFSPDSPLYDEGDFGNNIIFRNIFKSPIIINYYTGTVLREEAFFENAGSRFTYELINEDNKIGYTANLKFNISKIELTYLVYIDDEGLKVEVPNELIVEPEDRPIASISAFPYFGATKRLRTPGYVFIPDGIGALIRFDDRSGRQVYNKAFYGANLSLDQKTTDEPLYANLYGIVHGADQNGFVAIIESGAGNAILTSYPSRNTTDMNYTYLSFSLRVAYLQYLNQSKTSVVNLVQTNRNSYDIKINYQFLTGNEANYIGMAKKYQSYLVSNYELDRLTDDSNNRIHLDVLASENKKAIIGRKTFTMTTVDQLRNMVNSLKSLDINDFNITYNGWSNNGYSNTAPNYQRIESKLGSKNEFIDINNDFNNNDMNLYYQVGYPYASINGGGYTQNDLSQSIGQQYIEINSYYLMDYRKALLKYQDDYQKINQYGIKNISFDRLGNILYSNHFKETFNRSDSIEVIKEFLNVAENNAVSKPFSYLWLSKVVYDIPMYSSQQNKLTDTVPFIPFVLEGYSYVYGRPSNFFSNTLNELLRLIDYHMYPSFYLTHESSYLLLDTNSSHIFTSRFDDWQEEIVRQYQYVDQALNHVVNAQILKRTVLDLGFIENEYDNGVKIYINYSGNDYVTQDLISVAKMSYEVVLP
jgi:hypothetical protein